MENPINHKSNGDTKKLINNSIPVEYIKNKDIYNGLIDDLTCLVCLNIPIDPIQCSKCDIVLCKDCLEILNLSQKNCLSQECQLLKVPLKKLYLKTTKYVKEILEQLIIKCEFCNEEKINWSKYKNHLEEKCKIYKILPNKREDFIHTMKKLSEKEEELKIEVQTAKLSKLHCVDTEDKQEVINQIRASLITNILSPADKKILHNSILEGNLALFSSLILDRKFPIFEEISAKNYYWTSLHYSMHYGKWNLIEFCLNYVKVRGLFEKAMKLKSNDNRCPTLCLLKSNALKNEDKRVILEKLFKEYKILLTQDIKKEIIARNFNDVLEKFI
jgi:hypothetical protein